MDTDLRSERTDTTSPELLSPVSGDQAKLDHMLDTEQEAVFSGVLLARATTDIFDEFKNIGWSNHQKAYHVKGQDGKIFTAKVDGLMKKGDEEFDQVTMEMKRTNRHFDAKTEIGISAQEACEMFAVVQNLPPEKIERLRNSRRRGRQVLTFIST